MAVAEYRYLRGYSPSLRWVRDHAGFESNFKAKATLLRLREQGKIDFRDGFPRTLTLRGLFSAPIPPTLTSRDVREPFEK